MSKYSSTTHTTFNIGYHVVFSPKYLYNLLRYKVADILKELIQEKTCELGISIPIMEVMRDHVRLFIVAKPSLSIDKIIMELKGYSSYRLRHHFAYLQRYPSLWTRSPKVKSAFISQLKQGGFPR